MPGPVSESSKGPTDRSLKDEWLAELKEEGSKFFVLKSTDFLECLTSRDILIFNVMLKKHEDFRRAQGKSAVNRYWVVNRDEPYADQVKAIIEEHEGIKLLSERERLAKQYFKHGESDCYQDQCENIPFSSIGGLAARTQPKIPKYVPPAQAEDYLKGYISMAQRVYGDDWQTCSFGWKAALTIGGEDDAE